MRIPTEGGAREWTRYRPSVLWGGGALALL